MGKINILDKKIYNRIAAGEVVERPYSVVKELIENSIDAGATDITVNIYNGGKDLIQVIDNGSGIAEDDLPKAFLPHATSKIKNVEDLDSIETLGFRGEALASIAAVSKTVVVSRTADDDFGHRIVVEGGEIGDVEAYAAEKGTCISVESLFYNTPARAKFLKPNKSEETDISNIICRLMLANPSCSIKLNIDGNLVKQTFGGGIEEAIMQVYDFNTVKSCCHIDNYKNGLHIFGYIGKDQFTKPNKTYQTLILNGRYISNSTIHAAISNAYVPYLMKRRYPFYVLYIEINPEFVDVNVHPNKSDVRFTDNQTIYGTFYSIVSVALDQSREIPDIIDPKIEMQESSKDEEFIEPKSDVKKTDEQDNSLFDTMKDFATLDDNSEQTKTEEPEFEKHVEPITRSMPVSNMFKKRSKADTYDFDKGKKDKPDEFSPSISREQSIITFDNFFDFTDVDRMAMAKEPDGEERDFTRNFTATVDDIFAENKKYIEEIERKQKKNIQPELMFQSKMQIDSEFRVVGQIFKTYLVLEREDEIYLVDQHAAHERLKYNKFMDQYHSDHIMDYQYLAAPYEMRLNDVEADYMRLRMDDIRKLGICVCDSDDPNYFTIHTLPALAFNIDIKSFFDDIFANMDKSKDEMPEVFRDKLAMKACKIAIKSGKSLTLDEINVLLDELKYDLTLRCPHGRPIAVKISRTEMDKWFKRIV